MVPGEGTFFYPWVMIGRIHVKLRITMLHTEYKSFGSCGFRDFFSCISLYKPMANNDAPGM